jgi:hypothetical protein
MKKYVGILLFGCISVIDAHADAVSHNKIASWYSDLHPWIYQNRPHYSYEEGCMAYTSVDTQGNWNGGLKTGGSPGGSCRDSAFQHTVARIGFIGEQDQTRFGGAVAAIMYAQYMPKDQGNRASFFGSIGGHRHDWEEVVVFVNNLGHPIKVAASYHGDYKKMWKDASTAQYFDGNRVKIRYHAVGLQNNSFDFTTKLGSDPVKVDWDRIDTTYRTQVQDTITNVDWGSAEPKIVNRNFWQKIEQAW